MKILFICDYGRNRSVVGAQLLGRFLGDLATGISIESEGLANLRGRSHEVVRERMQTYDFIFCMDEKARTKLRRKYHVSPNRVKNLAISDLYDRHDPEDLTRLEVALTHKINPFLPTIRK